MPEPGQIAGWWCRFSGPGQKVGYILYLLWAGQPNTGLLQSVLAKQPAEIFVAPVQVLGFLLRVRGRSGLV